MILRRLRAGWPGRRAGASAFGAGVLMALGQSPFGLWPLALVALGWLFVTIGAAGGATSAFWLGLLGGAGYFALALNWIVSPFFVDPWVHGWMAPFALAGMAFGLGLFWAVAAMLAQHFGQRVLAFALLLAGAELLRGFVLTGFPWALIGHIWADTRAAQLVALTGANGLTLLTCVAVALPVAYGWRMVVAPVALALGVFVWAGAQLAQPTPAARDVTLRLVQPNAEQALKWDPDRARFFFDRLMAYTAAKPPVDLVIWPETALPYLLERSPEVAGMIAQAGQGAPVALGMQRTVGDRGWNTLAVIGPDGLISASYDKAHLVPFGEYIPYGDLMFNWFGISAFAAQVGNGYSAGPGPAVLDLGARLGKVLPLICYEAVFPQDLRATPERADWILQITNDAWFGTLTGPYQHFAQARLRAIEQGLPLVRAANTGISAVVDARGRVVAQLDLGQAAYLDVRLPGALAAPPYVRWGEMPVIALLLLGLCIAAIRRRVRVTA